MEPEFQRIILRVLLIGGVLVGVGTAALVVAFRGWEKQTQRSLIIVAFLLGFLLLGCIVLFALSVVR